MAVVTPTAKAQFIDAAGVPLAGGLLYTYAAGTTTPQATYTDSTGATANSNPIVLDSRGEANIWLGSATYKFKLCDSTNTELWTVDNISAPTSGLSPVLSGNVTIDSNSSGPALKITQTGTGPVLKVQDSADPDLTPFIIDNAGQVGIGTASPATALDINDGTFQLSSGGTSRTTLAADASNSTLSSVGARGLILNTNSTNLIYGTSSGYVGILNASPTVALDVTGAVKTSGNITGGAAISSTGAITAGSTLASTTTLTAGSSLTVTTSASIGTTLAVDTINGKTTSTDVTVGGVLCSNGVVAASAVRITAGTAKAYNWNGSSSNTVLDFTGIPSWVKRVSVMFNEVQTNAASALSVLIQIGTSSGVETSGYVGESTTAVNGSSPFGSTLSSGIILDVNGSASTYKRNGIITFQLLTGNTWAFFGNVGNSDSTRLGLTGGSKALSSTLDRVRITTAGAATDVFTGGTVNILYE